MNAIRQAVEVKNHRIYIEPPGGFDAEIVEVIILPKEPELNTEMNDSFYEEMEERRRKFESGESKFYSWEEVKARISASRNAV